MPKEYVLRIKPLTPEIRKLYENQQRTHKGDAGVDIYNSSFITLTNFNPNNQIQQYQIDFNIQCEVVKNYLTPDTFLEKKYSQKTLFEKKCNQKDEPTYEVGSFGKAFTKSLGDNGETPRDEFKFIEKSVNLSYLLVPRSSIVKTPFRMSNSIGIIDAGYRGNLMAFVDKLNNSDILRENERLFQIVLPNLKPIDRIEIVDELSSSSRGAGGFGSTGLK